MLSLRNVLAAAVISILGSASALGQAQIRFVEYSAKFLCGVVEQQAPVGAAVRPGIYDTSINIHNPQLPTQPLLSVTFVKKAVVALPEGEKPVPPSPFRRDILQADFAEQVDCRIIRAMLGPAGGAQFIEGYVVLIVFPSPLTVTHELDVTGVYTVNTQQQSIALEMVPISPRILTLSPAAGKQMRDQLMEQSKME